MARGLSDLQKQILILALEGHVSRGITPPIEDGEGGYKSDDKGLDIAQNDILVKLFDFKARYHYGNGKSSERIVLDRDDIGRERYNNGRATLSRAIKRLESRGLLTGWYIRYGYRDEFDTRMVKETFPERAIEEYWLIGRRIAGIRLTKKGVDVTKELSVNTSLVTTQSINR